MILFCVMRLIEDEKIDLLECYERMEQTLIENFCCANNDHIFLEVFLPNFLVPEIAAHLAAESFDLLIKIALKDRKLLKDQGNRIY